MLSSLDGVAALPPQRQILGGLGMRLETVCIPAHPGRRFRWMPATHFGNGRPPIPAQAGSRGSV